MAPGIWPRRNGFDFAMMACPGANAAGTGARGQPIAQVVKKRANSTEAA